MTDAGTRLALLVDDMLDVSRIRLGQLPLRIEPVDLVELIEQVTSRYEEQDPVPPHSFSLRVTETESIVPADRDRLEQVLSNVIDNAIKYSPEGGEIGLTLESDRDGFLIRIKDAGIGLPKSDVESIFDPFGRGSNVAISSLPGLGIGLFICRNIIERHRGRIWAESAGEGKGSTFSIWLPASDPLRSLVSST
jgi:signal transduction histidine kinase